MSTSIVYSESRENVTKAIFEARKMIGKAKKNAANAHFKNTYANLEGIIDAIRPALESVDLQITQTPVSNPDYPNILILETLIEHISGEFKSATISMPLPKNDPQGFASAATYARRIHLSALFGIAQTDDDGNSAVKTPNYYANEIKKAPDMEALKEIYAEAYKSSRDNPTGINVVKTAYDERKAALMAAGGTFVPPAKKKRDAEPQEAPVQENNQPDDLSGF